MKNLPISIKIMIVFIIIIIPISIINSIYTNTTTLYNTTVDYTLEYSTQVENQIITWDNYYLAFKEKSSIAQINKETFLAVTDIIMYARKDGENLAWKWCTENQQIPYEEFTIFYKELSQFTTMRFDENIAIERNKQSIVQKHNYLITTFPGVIYNYFLNIKPLEYKKGFVSSDSKKLFGIK